MIKIRLTIYSIVLIIFLSALFVSIFTLIKNNNSQESNSLLIPTPTLIPIIEITWPEAVNLIQNCQIESIFQKRKLEVTLTAKDNRIFKTTEPKFNDVFIETNNLRSDCNDIIQTITE